jgi:hypothetical protein
MTIIESGRYRNTVEIRGGPAAVIGYKARVSTVWSRPGGKGGSRLTRKPEDGRLD